MSFRFYTLLLFAFFAPWAARAQIPVNDPGWVFGGRVSAGAEKKLTPALKVFAEGEARLADRFAAQERYQVTGGMSYKVNPYFKTDLSYTFMEKRQYRSGFSPRHRVSLDATGQYRTGRWKFSLRERLQLTHRPGDMNRYQHPRNALALKSRVKAEYKISKQWTPYGSVEVRFALNDPSLKDFQYDADIRKYVTPSGSVRGEAGWFLSGYDDFSFHCVRGTAGLQYRLDSHNSFKFFFLADYCYGLEIDADKRGARLKSLVYDSSFRLTLGAGYTFSF